jgi:hypothetical protein
MMNVSRITDETIALMKGMLNRGDEQHDIAACFGENSGRVAEINRSIMRPPDEGEPLLTKRARLINAAGVEDLPPKGPYPTPYELYRAGNSIWGVRVTLEHLQERLDLTIKALSAMEITPRCSQ